MKHSDSVQALRGAAALAVVLAHCLDLSGASGAPLLDPAGAAAVSVFLFLSGYLWFVKGVALPPSRPSVESSVAGAVSRLRPLLPLHVVTWGASLPFLFWGLGVGGAAYGACVAFENLLLLQSWTPVREVYFSCNAVSWYLSTYAFAVAVSPFLLAAVRYLTADGARLGRAVVGIAACAVAEFILALAAPAEVSRWIVYVFPPARVLDVLAGMFCGAAFTRLSRGELFSLAPTSVGGGGIVIAILVTYGASAGEIPAWLYSAAWVLPSALIVTPLFSFDRVFLVMRPLVRVGDVSLQLFLVHQLVFRYLSHVPLLGGSPAALLLSSLALSLVAAVAVARVPGFQGKGAVLHE